MVDNKRLEYGFGNIQNIQVAKRERKCMNEDCENEVSKGENVAQVSNGLLCKKCSLKGINGSIKKDLRDVDKFYSYLNRVEGKETASEKITS